MRTSALATPLLACALALPALTASAADQPAPDQAPATAAPPAPVAAPAAAAPTAQPAAPASTAPAPGAQGAPPASGAQAPRERTPNDQVIEPNIDTRNVKVPHIPSSDFELGAFVGTYGTQNFGSSIVEGVRLGYHVTEDFFAEGVYGQTKVSDELYRQILPGGIFPTERETLRYYNLSAGYNVFAGELFLGRRTAKVSTLYLIAGVGNTEILSAQHLTLSGGVGLRLFLTDWAALQVDARDHVFSVDLLGTRKSTQNLEFTGGLTFFF